MSEIYFWAFGLGLLMGIAILLIMSTVVMPVIWHLMERADEFWTKVFGR